MPMQGDVFDTVDIDALAASATIGCLERPDVGKVIVLGAQPDCINDDLRVSTRVATVCSHGACSCVRLADA